MTASNPTAPERSARAFTRFPRKALLLLAGASLLPGMVLADTPNVATKADTSDPTPQDGSASAVGDIVVTATRRESKLQSTPVAVSVLGQGEIAAHNTITARDLAGQIPGFFIAQSGITPSTQIFYIRGIGNSDPIFDPSVAVYLDDTYLPRAINGMTDLTDIERVELLRGPQGTLFGQNAAAGAIRYITKTPTEKLTAKGDVSYGSYNTANVHGYVSGALIPGLLSASLAVAHDQHEGYTWNPTLNRRVNDQDTTGGRFKLLFTPSSKFKALITLDGTVDHSSTAYYTPVRPIIGGTLARPVYGAYQPNTSYASQAPLNKSWTSGASAKLSYEIDPHLTVHAISSLRRFAQDPVNYNNDGQPLVPYSTSAPQLVSISDNLIKYHEKEFTQELQLQGQYGPVDFTGGLFYLYEDFSSDRIGYVVSATAASANPANPFDQIGDTKTHNYAAYLQGNWHATNRLTITLGGRYSTQKRQFTFAGITTDFNGNPISSAANFTYQGSKVWRNFTPKVGLSYQFAPTIFGFVSVAKGVDAGGYNNRATSLASALPYDQETVTTYEAGFKTDWLGHRLRINATGFYNDYRNLQATASVISPVNNTLVSARSNAPKAHTAGFELETTAQPTSRLTANANASYLLTRYDNFPNAGGTTAANLISVTGNQLPFSPRWQLSGGGSWRLPLRVPGEVSLNANATYETSYFSDVYNYAQARVPAQAYLNAGLSYTPAGGHWTLSVTGKNLTNHIAYQSITWGGTPSLWLGPQNPPRTVVAKIAFAY
ncbi:TonB-dependent receptor [Novosphingobium rosa]|uniref:TonB-dependent receptor n=1 Tax=Novosphingobium rosa TaxID=76978 RepID=UPI0008362D89|nr:TonB-dependent receptor [Novosphingobium rosa]